MEIAARLIDAVHERGPLTVAAFMQLALYDPELGYYARAPQRSGRAGDFFTSVDVGPLFGKLLELQLAEMAGLLTSGPDFHEFDLVEVGAGNGRLSADILRAARRRDPAFYSSIRLHLVEASESARRAHSSVLNGDVTRLASSGAELPPSFEGALLANELLDAMPVHQVVMRGDQLREVYITCQTLDQETRSATDRRAPGLTALTTIEGPPSTPRLNEYLQLAGVKLEPGWRVEISLSAVDWMRDAARRLRRGFIIIVDYGHEARELYSLSHATGTLTTFSNHWSEGPETTRAVQSGAPAHSPPWLKQAGDVDMTAHVDFTSIRAAAEIEGLETLGFLDQTYFLLGLWGDGTPFVEHERDFPRLTNALKTLVMPGGMGSSHKVLILGKNVGRPALRACAFRMRVT